MIINDSILKKKFFREFPAIRYLCICICICGLHHRLLMHMHISPLRVSATISLYL